MSDPVDPLKKWRMTREKGAVSFVFFYGVCGWGIGGGVVFSIIFSFVVREFEIRLFPLAIAMFAVGGVSWGTCMWYWAESRYAAAMAEIEMKNKVAQLEEQVAQLRRHLPQQPNTNFKE